MNKDIKQIVPRMMTPVRDLLQLQVKVTKTQDYYNRLREPPHFDSEGNGARYKKP
jgi:hypothetical protein